MREQIELRFHSIELVLKQVRLSVHFQFHSTRMQQKKRVNEIHHLTEIRIHSYKNLFFMGLFSYYSYSHLKIKFCTRQVRFFI